MDVQSRVIPSGVIGNLFRKMVDQYTPRNARMSHVPWKGGHFERKGCWFQPLFFTELDQLLLFFISCWRKRLHDLAQVSKPFWREEWDQGTFCWSAWTGLTPGFRLFLGHLSKYRVFKCLSHLSPSKGTLEWIYAAVRCCELTKCLRYRAVMCGIEQWFDFAVPYLCDAWEKGFSATTKSLLNRNGIHQLSWTIPKVPKKNDPSSHSHGSVENWVYLQYILLSWIGWFSTSMIMIDCVSFATR